MIRRWDTMRTIFAAYNVYRNSIDIYPQTGYMLRIDCNKAEDGIKTTPCSQCALNVLAIDEHLMQNYIWMELCRYG